MNPTPPHILVVDDENSVREMITILLTREKYQVIAARNGNAAIQLLEDGNRYDLVITDMAMDRGGGMLVLEQVKIRDPHCPVILITAFGTTDTAVEAMKKGAHDYINKPFNIEEFKMVVRQALSHRELLRENIDLRARLSGEKKIADIAGHSEAIRQIANLCVRIADSPAAVLLTGESGTGKEVVARAIHFAGNRRTGPFVAVNCGALPEALMESELFGHVKGAFTGAADDKIGLVQSAHRGTLFLDEIGDLPQPLQVKLLRVLQEKQIRRVGGATEEDVDVRFVSATNRDLEEAVRNNQFRTDLYYRLNVVSIAIPPLRERTSDIRPLIDTFLPQLALEHRSRVRGIHPDALRVLMQHDYPGNVRELKNILERAVALTTGDLIGLQDLPPALQPGLESGVSHRRCAIPDEGIQLDEVLASTEREYIRTALEITGGVQSAAARLLGITVPSLRYRLREETDENKTAGESK